MANGKKSFILYADLIQTVDKLPREVKGDLFQLILDYVNDRNPVINDNLLLEILFEPVKLQLKRDLKKWEDKSVINSESGRKGGLISAAKRSESKQTLENPSESKRIQPVTVTVNDNVSVNDNVINKNSIRTASPTIEVREKLFYESIAEFKDKYPKEMLRAFFDHWREPNKSKTKMLWELKPTWDLNLRLIKWSKNQSIFNKTNYGKENKRITTDQSKPGTEYAPL